MNAQQLKNSILQMAVQGKLVPQDPNDEPASVLLERIRAEKEKLIKEGKIKKEKNPSYIFRGEDNLPYEKVGKNEPVCIADEVPFEIPESWEWVRLKNITNVVSARRVHQSDWKTEGIPFYRAREIGALSEYGQINNDLFISEELFEEFSKSGVPQAGDLMVTAVGTLGKVYIVKETDRFYYKDASVICLENFGKLVPEYLKIVIHSPYLSEIIKKKSAGTTVDTITIVKANEYLIPIPPIDEQIRIVGKIAECDPFIEKYSAKESTLTGLNDRFPDLLKKSILQQAVMGKLVPQDPDDEPASVLLDRIRAEKQELIKAGKLKKDKHESIIYRRDNSHYEKRNRQEVCIDDDIPFDIPTSWCWCHISDMCFFQEGPGILGKDFRTEGVPLIRIAGMQTDRVTLDGCNYLEPDMVETKWNHFRLDKGDIVVSTSASLDKIAEVDDEAVGAIPYTGLIRFKMFGGILKEYFMLFIKSPCYINQIAEQEAGAAIKHYGPTHLRKMVIPIPPIPEQQRIVAEVKSLSVHISTL